LSGEGAIMQTGPSEFANSVIELLSSSVLRQSTGEAGMKLVKSHFDWDIIASTLEGYFKEIAGQ